MSKKTEMAVASPTAPATGPRARARGNGTTTPTVWTPDRVAAVCQRHATGVFLKHACALEGASADGLAEACKRDPSILLAVQRAHAEGVELLRQRKDSAMPGEDDWKKYAWDLERFDREAFSPPTQKLDAQVVGAVSLVAEVAAMARKMESGG